MSLKLKLKELAWSVRKAEILNILSFSLSGDFAAFRDPSVTTNQTVYFIPSKSSVVGLLGALIGVSRSNRLETPYSKPYIELFSNTKIGLKLQFIPKKTVFFTNHRSLKESKTKPFKTELVESPKYTLYVETDESHFNEIVNSIKNNNFVYSPYLGHAYCPARIDDLQVYDKADIIDDPEGMLTSSIILDESETYKMNFPLRLYPVDRDSKIIIERHLHHFLDKNNLEARVLKHWIPVNSTFKIERISKTELSRFISMDGKNGVCFY